MLNILKLDSSVAFQTSDHLPSALFHWRLLRSGPAAQHLKQQSKLVSCQKEELLWTRSDLLRVDFAAAV